MLSAPDAIVHNPYRVLGLYANATTRDLHALKAKAKAYARVGEALPMPLHLEGVLGPIDSSPEAVASAEAALAMPQERERWALMWFERNDDSDDHAVELLANGDVQEAMQLWAARTDPAALQNLMVLNFIVANADGYAFAQRRHPGLEQAKMLLRLLTNFPDDEQQMRKIAGNRARLITEPEWQQAFESLHIEHYGSLVRKELDAAKRTDERYDDLVRNGLEASDEANDCLKECQQIAKRLLDQAASVDCLTLALGREHVVVQTLSEELAREMWDYAVEYNNKVDGPAFLIKVSETAMRLAVSDSMKKFLKEQHAIAVRRCRHSLVDRVINAIPTPGGNKASGKIARSKIASAYDKMGEGCLIYMIVIILFAIFNRCDPFNTHNRYRHVSHKYKPDSAFTARLSKKTAIDANELKTIDSTIKAADSVLRIADSTFKAINEQSHQSAVDISESQTFEKPHR